jgi:predicted PurR-regulated permease PerM
MSVEPSSVDSKTPASTPVPAAPLLEGADPRRLSHIVVTSVALAFALGWGKQFFIPLSLGIVLAYTLSPLVNWLERRHVHRWLGATLVMFVLVGGSGYVASSLRDEAQTIVSQLPDLGHRLHDLTQDSTTKDPGLIQSLRQAEQEMEGSATQPTGRKSGPLHVVVDEPSVNLNDLMLTGSRNLAAVAGQLLMVLFLVYFLLLSGDAFKRKLVKLTGPSLSSKKITVQTLDEINVSVQRYMLAMFTTNVILAGLTWALFRWAGLQNAGAWAVAAGVLHVVPYLGSVLTAILTGGAALLQSGSWTLLLITSGGSLLIAGVVGIVITTWMTGRITRMNPAAIFVALLFWSCLWGVWGALLAVPITGIIKAVCQRVERFRPLAEMLAD